ncbi:hypothetical protein [Microbacterium sp. 8M]|jgi:hypothetical protein|uniref:hypothetical protein n=1 Tax=Microbacterium sp. 8M TaxID=2653153 RepID=UPI00135B5C72|nr:hypothetical protein [Microbacterium sp. 8M]
MANISDDANRAEDIEAFLESLRRTPISLLAHGQAPLAEEGQAGRRRVTRRLARQLEEIRRLDRDWCERIAPRVVADPTTRSKISLLLETTRVPVEMVNGVFPSIGFGLILGAVAVIAPQLFEAHRPAEFVADLPGIFVAILLAGTGYYLLWYGTWGLRWIRTLRIDLLALVAAVTAHEASCTPPNCEASERRCWRSVLRRVANLDSWRRSPAQSEWITRSSVVRTPGNTLGRTHPQVVPGQTFPAHGS